MRRRATYLLILLLVVTTMIVAGCGSSNDEEDILGTRFTAYQYAKSEIQNRLPFPNSAIFPHISDQDYVDISGIDGEYFEVSGIVEHRESDIHEYETSEFAIVVIYQGNGLWEIESLDLDL
ncbi:hypothetical protein [Dethiobacter alkaliphilus]|uniref:hypothetical protein n=1 Tax=Dethiobacter alkaliphilus TaxID=427926 RepID=UPI002227F366|nr:hypothetical protein [Dethiobacter alkaliphilus]MCW3491320.1 hypothetical protein [Dethiobacter alkaliphilus]